MLRISNLEQASRYRWSEVFLACDYATYFHSPSWAETWSEYSNGGWISEPQQVIFSDGCEAIIMLARSGSGSDASHVSSFAGTFGGWLSLDPLTVEHGRLMQGLLLAKTHLVWRRNPYDPIADVLPEAPGQQQDSTIAIDLRAGEPAIAKLWERGSMRWAVKKAKRSGLTTRLATQESDWEDYFSLYESSLQRWGPRASSRYDWGLFEALQKRPGVRLWLVCREENPVGGALVFYARRHAVYWHGAADAAWFPLQPINLLIQDIVLDALRAGCWWFDFNPSGSHKGVADFKLHCGGVPIPSPVICT